jgi:Raf kinase inhibitor-like YbhB/YbcL family protein
MRTLSGSGRCVLAIAAILVLGTCVSRAQQNTPPAAAPPAGQGGQRGGAAPPAPFRLMSPGFADGAPLPAKYTCSVEQNAVSPPLRWTGAPNARTMGTFALIVHDMEPRPGKGVDDILHWMVWNIPANATLLPEGAPAGSPDLPDGSRQTNGNPGNGGIVGYRPPCPPENVALPHHYAFELFALDIRLDLPDRAMRADLMKAMDGHVIAHAAMVVPFNR